MMKQKGKYMKIKNKIKTTADNIYAYCTYAMDFDMMGLTFDESSFLNALQTYKEDLSEYTEEDFLALKKLLESEIRSRYESNRDIVYQGVDEGDVVGKMYYSDAKDEMVQTEMFLTYVDKEVDYTFLKKIVGQGYETA